MITLIPFYHQYSCSQLNGRYVLNYYNLTCLPPQWKPEQNIVFLLPAAVFNPTALWRAHLCKSHTLLVLLSRYMEQMQPVSLSLCHLKRHKQAKIKHTPILAPALQPYTPTALSLNAHSGASAFATYSSQLLSPQRVFHPNMFFTFNPHCTIKERKSI